MTTDTHSQLPQRLALLPDVSRVEGSDKLNAYRDALFAAITGTPAPFNVGIFGEWGSGKTTLMRMVHDQLEHQKVPVVWFSAWRHQHDKTLVVPLLDAIALELDKPTSWERWKHRLRRTAELFLNIARATPLTLAGIPEKYHPVNFVDAARVLMTEDRSSSKYTASLEYLQTLSAKLAIPAEDIGSDAKAVVFIDDLDRCLPLRALELLEGVKTLFEAGGFVFVLALDRHVIDEFVSRVKYEWMEEGQRNEIRNSSHYVAKIIQIPFNIPPPDADEIKEYAGELLQSALGGAEELEALAEIVLEGAPRNWRLVKRLINEYLLQHAVQTALTGQPQNSEASLVLLALNQRWIQLYSMIARQGRSFIVDLGRFYGTETERQASDFPVIYRLLSASTELDEFLDPTTGKGRVLYELDDQQLASLIHASTNVGIQVSQEQQAVKTGRDRTTDLDMLWRLAEGNREDGYRELRQAFESGDRTVRRVVSQALADNIFRWDIADELIADDDMVEVLDKLLTDYAVNSRDGEFLRGGPGAALVLLEAGRQPNRTIYNTLLQAFEEPDGRLAAACRDAFEQALQRHPDTRDDGQISLREAIDANTALPVRIAGIIIGLNSGLLEPDKWLQQLLGAFRTSSTYLRASAEAIFRMVAEDPQSVDFARDILTGSLKSAQPDIRTASAILLTSLWKEDLVAIDVVVTALPDEWAETTLREFHSDPREFKLIAEPLHLLVQRRIASLEARIAAVSVLLAGGDVLDEDLVKVIRDGLGSREPNILQRTEVEIRGILAKDDPTTSKMTDLLREWSDNGPSPSTWRAALLLLEVGETLNDRQMDYIFGGLAENDPPGELKERIQALTDDPKVSTQVMRVIDRARQHSSEEISKAASDIQPLDPAHSSESKQSKSRS